MPPPRSVIVCTTPRSGSTLVCALLRASGQAGHPESWYRAEDREDYARDWGLPPGGADPAAYLAAAIRAGQDGRPDGTCGLRLQPPALPAFLADLRAVPGPGGSDLARMRHALGRCDFVFVSRRDDVAQAVSRLKAEVSQVWHLDGTEGPPQGRASYDPVRIDAFRTEAAEGNRLWERWFAAEGIEPRRIVYEDIRHDPAGAIADLLATIGLSLPPGLRLAVPNRPMADAESADWAARYRRDRDISA